MSGLQSLKKTENNITKFEIYPNSGGKPIEISQGVVKLSYYENILSETIRITLMVVDTGNVSADSGTSGIDDILKIGNGEKVFLDFEDGDSTPNKLKFSKEENALYLTEKEKVSEHTQKAVYRIELVSKEYLKNEQTRVIKRYDGKISESVRKILTEVLETKNLGDWCDHYIVVDETGFEGWYSSAMFKEPTPQELREYKLSNIL